jgi:hypothetical protein
MNLIYISDDARSISMQYTAATQKYFSTTEITLHVHRTAQPLTAVEGNREIFCQNYMKQFNVNGKYIELCDVEAVDTE